MKISFHIYLIHSLCISLYLLEFFSSSTSTGACLFQEILLFSPATFYDSENYMWAETLLDLFEEMEQRF